MPTLQNTKTISDLRENPVGLLKKLRRSYGPLYIFYHSKPSAVMLNPAEYQKLLNLVEDYLDSLRAEGYEKLNKKEIAWIDHKNLINQLK